MPEKSGIGARLRAERERIGLRQDELAGRIGKARNTISAWENDEQSPNALLLLDMSGLGIDVLYVLTGQRGVDTVGMLSAEESALVDNYRHASPQAQAGLRAVGAALAEQDRRKEQARKAGNQ